VEHQRHGRIPAALLAVAKAQAALASGSADEPALQRVSQRRRDLEIVLELEDVRLEVYADSNNSASYDPTPLDAAYARVFKKHGIEVEGLDAEVAGERIRARTVAIELAAALDNWAMSRWVKWNRGKRRAEPGPWQHLLAIAGAADPNPLRNRVRQLLAKMDQKALAELVASTPPADLPAQSILMLAEVLFSPDPHGPAVDLLRRAQRLHPDNFWINHHLAMALQDAQPSEWDEAVRFCTAALAS